VNSATGNSQIFGNGGPAAFITWNMTTDPWSQMTVPVRIYNRSTGLFQDISEAGPVEVKTKGDIAISVANGIVSRGGNVNLTSTSPTTSGALGDPTKPHAVGISAGNAISALGSITVTANNGSVGVNADNGLYVYGLTRNITVTAGNIAVGGTGAAGAIRTVDGDINLTAGIGPVDLKSARALVASSQTVGGVNDGLGNINITGSALGGVSSVNMGTFSGDVAGALADNKIVVNKGTGDVGTAGITGILPGTQYQPSPSVYNPSTTGNNGLPAGKEVFTSFGIKSSNPLNDVTVNK
jgi:hypothetical protein